MALAVFLTGLVLYMGRDAICGTPFACVFGGGMCMASASLFYTAYIMLSYCVHDGRTAPRLPAVYALR